jgi:membrane protein implicated in regulation of membrane protease activity
MSRLLLIAEALFLILGACVIFVALSVAHVPRLGIPGEFFTLAFGVLLLLASIALRFLRRRELRKPPAS